MRSLSSSEQALGGRPLQHPSPSDARKGRRRAGCSPSERDTQRSPARPHRRGRALRGEVAALFARCDWMIFRATGRITGRYLMTFRSIARVSPAFGIDALPLSDLGPCDMRRRASGRAGRRAIIRHCWCHPAGATFCGEGATTVPGEYGRCRRNSHRPPCEGPSAAPRLRDGVAVPGWRRSARAARRCLRHGLPRRSDVGDPGGHPVVDRGVAPRVVAACLRGRLTVSRLRASTPPD